MGSKGQTLKTDQDAESVHGLRQVIEKQFPAQASLQVYSEVNPIGFNMISLPVSMCETSFHACCTPVAVFAPLP